MTKVMPQASSVPCGMAMLGFFRSPDMFAPARIPVAAGKNTAKTVKKLCSVPSNVRKAGTKLVMNVSPMDRKKHPATHCMWRKKMARTEPEKEAYMHNCTCS